MTSWGLSGKLSHRHGSVAMKQLNTVELSFITIVAVVVFIY